MMPAITDIAGINRLSRQIIANAAGAIAGMVKVELPPDTAQKPVIGATMFGVTTPCVMNCKKLLEAKGYEVIVFHAAGAADEFRMRNRSLLLELASLSPETRIAADALNVLMSGATGTAMTLGLLGSAIGLAAYAYSQFSAAQEESKRKTQEVISALKTQRDTYLKLVEAVDEASMREHLKGRAGGNEDLARRIAQAAGKAEFGREAAMQSAETATAAIGAGNAMPDEALWHLGVWQSLGKRGSGRTTGRGRYQAFAALMRQPGAREKLQAEWESYRSQNPSLAARNREEARQMVGGGTPSAQAGNVYDRIAARETSEGNPITAEEVRQILGTYTAAAEGGPTRLGPGFYRRGIQEWVRKYPELGQVQMGPPQSGSGQGLHPRTSVAPGQEGVTVIQIIGQSNSGVTYNDRGGDPAGVMPRNGMR
jgi:hypothetical protein